MKAFNQTLQGTLQSPNQYVIPVFQRYYSWKKENWEKLWDDLTELYTPEQANRHHFMGSLVFVPEKHYPSLVPAYQVIDGQQRLITLSLLLCALRDVASSLRFNELAEEITVNYLVHHFKKGREHFRVFPRQRDRDLYLAAIEQKDTAKGHLSVALSYFSDQVKTIPNASTEDGLRALFNILQTRLEFVHIVLDSENPYRIFKSLNSTGVDLSEADLIRNFVFMHVDIEYQDEFDEKLWKPMEKHFEDSQGNLDGSRLSSFFRDFLMYKGKYISPDTTFDAFEQQYTGTSFEPEELAEELMHNAFFYDVVRGTQVHSSKEANLALAQLRGLESSTTYPLVLNLLHKVEDGVMSIQDLEHAFELLAGFIMRRLVCGESSRAYGRWFVSACTELGSSPLDGLWKFLNSKGYPSNARFKADFAGFNLYGSRYCLFILKTLEKAHSHKEPADLSQAQIEHVMPQKMSPIWITDLGSEAERIHSKWLHTIGNLTLSAYNPELSNKPFDDKRKWYATSNIVLTRSISEYEKWTETEIIERRQKLTELAAQVWIGPDK